MNIIETENLSYKYDESHFALSDLSIGFEKGKITTILGANGAGKSTLFLNMNGILKPHSGTVKFMGKPIGYSKKEIRELRKSVGIVFQDPDDQLFSASVFQDVSFGAMNLKLPQDEVVHLTENFRFKRQAHPCIKFRSEKTCRNSRHTCYVAGGNHS